MPMYFFLIFGIFPKKCEKFDFCVHVNAQDLQMAWILNLHMKSIWWVVNVHVIFYLIFGKLFF